MIIVWQILTKKRCYGGDVKGYGTFFDELCLIMIALFGGLKPTLHYCGALGRRDRLELSMVAPELVSRFQGITFGLWAKGCYTDTRRGLESYTETIYTSLGHML